MTRRGAIDQRWVRRRDAALIFAAFAGALVWWLGLIWLATWLESVFG